MVSEYLHVMVMHSTGAYGINVGGINLYDDTVCISVS